MDATQADMPPQDDETLRLVPTAHYGDALPGEGRRGGALHLSAVLPALSSALGHPVVTDVHRDARALQEALGFPRADSAIVVLVDGLGFWNLSRRLGHAPYLRSLMRDAAHRRPISTCAPSTTVAAMGVFGTGTCPGLTGMAGYTQREPGRDRLVQLIQFKDPLAQGTDAAPVVAPADLQRRPTVFELLRRQGVRVTSSGLAKFKNSPLTAAALRGSDYIAGVTPRERVHAAAQAAREPGLTYLYIRDADKIGHSRGWDCEQWIATFEHIDAQLALLARLAPKGTLIVVTADHGMVSADPAQRVDLVDHPQLRRGVRLVGGEPRSLMLYADDDPDAVADRWREYLGERALVRTKAQVIADGLFGPVDARVDSMLGDVIVQAAQRTTIVDSSIQSDKATRLPGVHGSQSMMEMDVPCLVDVT